MPSPSASNTPPSALPPSTPDTPPRGSVRSACLLDASSTISPASPAYREEKARWSAGAQLGVQLLVVDRARPVVVQLVEQRVRIRGPDSLIGRICRNSFLSIVPFGRGRCRAAGRRLTHEVPISASWGLDTDNFPSCSSLMKAEGLAKLATFTLIVFAARLFACYGRPERRPANAFRTLPACLRSAKRSCHQHLRLLFLCVSCEFT